MVSPSSHSFNEFFLITLLLYIFGGKKINYMNGFYCEFHAPDHTIW